MAEGGPEFTDAPALVAGELRVPKDSAGDVEAVLLANNSGHFKPRLADLENALPFLEELGLRRDEIVLFAAPNNLPSMFADMEQRLGMTGLVDELPPDPRRILDDLAAQPVESVVSVRVRQRQRG